MAPSRWDDEEEDSTPPSSPPAPVIRRGKFDDEEEDSDVLESWDAADDSETERAKAKAAAEAKVKADALAAANKKPKAQRIEERRMENMRRRAAAEAGDSSDEEDDAEQRERLRRTEKDSDLKHAEDLFAGVGISNNRGAAKVVSVADAKDPTKTVDLSSMKMFDPQTRDQFIQLRETLTHLVAANAGKAQYPLFMKEFVKSLCKELGSDQVKQVASVLTTMANEKMKEEKAAEKGGKKSKAAKTKSTLNAARDTVRSADTNAYDDGLEEDDFM